MMVKKGFSAKGTICSSCEKIIIKQAMEVMGVKKVTFDIATEKGYVTFDDKKTNIDEILYKIEEKNYTCYILDENKKKNKNKNNIKDKASDHTSDQVSVHDLKQTFTSSRKKWGWVIATIGIVVAGYFLFHFIEGISVPTISQNMGYGLLFIVGLLTGFHCVGMCGGFVISYTTKDAQQGSSPHKSHLKYGLGKTISYTLIGAIFGLLGSFIAFTPVMRGVAGLLAGMFLILFGLKMLNIFPALRKIQFRTPAFIDKFVGKKSKGAGPLTVGLLNGLMIACGPLQAIYIMAAGTGSMIEGAKLLFVFALGTLPVMLGFGYFASYISSKMTQKILKASGALVILLGLIMVNNGLVLTGSGYDFGSITGMAIASEMSPENNPGLTKDGFQVIKMNVTRYGWEPSKFVLEKDVPVRWIIDGQEINGCNNAIQVPKYGLEFDIKQGKQIIEFTPEEEGVVRWSCWMGMIPGSFLVKDSIDIDDKETLEKEAQNIPEQRRSGSCGGSCGSSTCGATRGGSCGCS